MTVPAPKRVAEQADLAKGRRLGLVELWKGIAAATGIDCIDVSAGIYESAPWIVQPMEMPQGCLTGLSKAIRATVKIPVSVAGRISDPEVAESALASGSADFVTLGRALAGLPWLLPEALASLVPLLRSHFIYMARKPEPESRFGA